MSECSLADYWDGQGKEEEEGRHSLERTQPDKAQSQT